MTVVPRPATGHVRHGEQQTGLRLLFWADAFWPSIGGMEVWAARFVRALHERGHFVSVVTTHTGINVPDLDDYHGIPVHRLPLWEALKSNDVRQVAQARQRVAELRKALRPQCVHLNMCGPTVLFYLLTRDVAPAPSLLTLHGEWPDRYAQPGSLLARSLESSDWIVAVSQSTLDWAQSFHPELASRASVIGHAIDKAIRASDDEAASLPSIPHLLCLGRLSHEKGFDLALRAFARVARALPGARLDIAGDGMERGALEALARELGIAGSVDFLGWVSPGKIPSLLRRCSLVLIPSRSEGFGLAALEAAALARTAVAANVGGLREVIDHGSTGLLVAPEDPEAMAEAALRLLRDPDRLAEMGRCARDFIARHGTWKQHVDAYDIVIRRLAAKHADAAGSQRCG